MSIFTTYLPVPPTTNNLFVNNRRTGGRFPSGAYEKWKKSAAKCFQGIDKPLEGRIHAIYKFVFPDKRRRDVENFAKAPSDFLTAQKVFHDDSQIDHLELVRSEGTIPGVYITLTEIIQNSEQPKSNSVPSERVSV